MLNLNVDTLSDALPELKAGDQVTRSGTVYTARDAAHKRIAEMIRRDEKLPFDVKGSVIYYAGPTPTVPGSVIGSCGPTTSGRMDKYAPALYDMGMIASIGKGPRLAEVVEAIVRNGAVYFAALGGIGALAAEHIASCDVIAFDDLGCESVKKLAFRDFPLIVAVDSRGASVFN